MKKRICALVMCCTLFVAMMPSTVLAEVEADTETRTEESAEEGRVSADKLSFGDGISFEIVSDSELAQQAAGEDASESVLAEAAEIAAPDTDAGDSGSAVIDGEIPDDAATPDDGEIPDGEEIPDDGESPDVVAVLAAEERPESDETASTDLTFTKQKDGVSVTVTAPAGALPEGSELSVRRFAQGSAEYNEAAEAIGFEEDDESGMAALDISFMLDGEEVEPTEAVKVSIDVSGILPEEADAGTIEIRHLEEDGDTLTAVVVANASAETEGTIDPDAAVAEFELDSFSPFTVTWSWSAGGTGTNTATVTVNAYLDGTAIEGIDNVTFDSVNDELDFETLLSDVNYGTGDYTFLYAIGTIGNVTYGSETNPIVAVEITLGTTGGPATSNYFRVVYLDGTYVDVATTSSLTIDAYYATPSLTVEIIAVAEDEAEDWELKAVVTHATSGSALAYEWWVTDTDGGATELAYVANTDNTGEALIVWSEDAEDNQEIAVHVRVTETDASGTVIATAETTYVLEYQDETVDLQMTYGPNQTALPASVTVTVSNEYHTYTGTTDEDGWVHDLGEWNEQKQCYEIEPGIYTVTAEYTDAYGNTYRCEKEVSLHDAGNYSLNLDYYNPDILTYVPDKDNWEHIDIKISLSSTGSLEGDITLNITSATIYDSAGNEKAATTEVTQTDNEYQLHWSTGDGNTHATSFSSSDYIVISYTLTMNGVTTEHTLILSSETVYASGSTYPATGQRSYKLYNYLYGTSYESDAQLIAAGIEEIDVSGMSIMLVGAILCDSSVVSGAGQIDVSSVQCGIDFAMSVNAINELSTSWSFEVEKTYYNASMLAGNFEYVLYDATVAGDTWTQGSANSTLRNGEAAINLNGGYSTNTAESLAIAYSDEDIENGKTYYYILSETPDTVISSSGAEITFDDTVYGVKVELRTNEDGDATVTATYYLLTANADGTYTAAEYTGGKITIDEDTLEPTFRFENTYQEYVTVSGTKVWEDDSDAAGKRPGSITVNLLKNGSQAVDENGNSISVTVTGAGDTWDWSFEKQPVWDGYTENTYAVSEEITVDDYDTEITQDTATGAYTITNTYTGVSDVTAEIQVAKSYVDSAGAAMDSELWPDGGFEFTLTAAAGSADVPMPSDDEATVTVSDTDAASFGVVTYEGAGTYYYQITETATGKDYITDDAQYHYVRVVVTDDTDTGALVAAVSYLTSDEAVADFTADNLAWSDTDTAAVFTDTYSATGSVQLGVTKTITGRSSTAKSFTFALYSADESFNYNSASDLIKDQSTYGTLTEGEPQSVVFDTTDTIVYTQAGDYYYVIKETTASGGGWTCDGTEYHVTVSTSDNGEGTISVTEVTYTYTDSDGNEQGGSLSTDGSGVYGTYGDNTLNFTNTYAASGTLSLSGTKTYENGEDADTAITSFTYTVKDAAGAAVGTGTTDEDGTIQFTFDPEITYSLSDVGTEITYTITEDLPEGANADNGYTVNGVTYDTNGITVTVTLTDNGDGTLAVSTAYTSDGGESSGAVFTNSYAAAGTSAQFAGTKYLSNSTGTDKVFTFELYETGSSFATTGVTPETVSTSGSIDANNGQNFAFTAISYDTADTYYYVIKEQAVSYAGWTVSETVYEITVEVIDNGEGQLVASVSYVTESDSVERTVTGDEDVYRGFDFTNTYAASGGVTLTAVKSLEGRTDSNTTFTFALYESDATFAEGDRIEETSTVHPIETSQSVSFEEIPYTYDSQNTDPTTYYYLIKETTTDGSGWTCDTGVYHVTVTVTDDGSGTLTTEPSYVYVAADGTERSADNATFTNTYAATGALNLSGTKTLEGGTLGEGQFTYTVKEGETEVATGTVEAGGAITFTQISYTYTDLGEHTYTVTEDDPEDEGIVYDDTVYTVIVTVTDDETGKLDVSYRLSGAESGAISFTNYQKGSLTVTKTFTGLTEEQIAGLTGFTITVAGSDQTAATLTLDDATGTDGSYRWTISNLVSDTYTVTESGYSADGYEVIAQSGSVTVTDGGDVSASDALAWGGNDTVSFTNAYTEVGSISVSKYVVAEEDIQDAHMDTAYTVVLTADGDVDLQWVTVTSDSNSTITPDIAGRTVTFTITENETVTVSGLPAGSYTVEETGSDASTSGSFVPIYKVGEHETETAPTVTVASGKDNIVEIELENEYPIGTYLLAQKVYNKEPYPDEGFTFTVEALSCDPEAEDVTIGKNDMPLPENSSVTITESGEPVSFGTIIYEHLGTYYYKVTETKGSAENVVYDPSVCYVKVEVGSSSGTYVEYTDEYACTVEAETDDYKDLTYTEQGIVTAEFVNTYLEELTIEKEVAGTTDTEEYEFEITLTESDGTPYSGEITVKTGTAASRLTIWSFGLIRTLRSDTESAVTFEDGKATVVIGAGEEITLLVPSGVTCTVTETTTGADTTTVYDGDGNVITRSKGTAAEATAEVGTIADSTTVRFVNSYRSYFQIDEEIVTDEEDIFDTDAWVKNEAVNEYNAIEIEMTTNLPVMTGYDLENGSFTLNFHDELDHELVLDEDSADFSVYIAGQAIGTAYYRITFDDDTGDDCNFHVDVDLTALYQDGYVTEDMLDGTTEITIFFFADLEGTGLNGSYKSTVWYDIYDGDEWLFTSEPSEVEVYTYEIEILKYDASTLDGTDYAGSALAGAVFGVYYDKDCTDPVIRSGSAYTAVSGEDGMAIFYGLADGTYYLKELEAPSGYVTSTEILTATLGSDLDGYVFETVFANEPEEPTSNPDDGGSGSGGNPDDGGSGSGGTQGGGSGSGGTQGGSGTTPTQSTGGTKTGDNNAVFLWVLLLAAAGLLGVTGVAMRTRRPRRSNRR